MATRLEGMQALVEREMLGGARFSDVEDLINGCELPTDEQAALWLLAWSYQHPRAQRREAKATLAMLSAAGRFAASARPPPSRLNLV